MGSAASSPRRTSGSPPPFSSADLSNTVLSSLPPATALPTPPTPSAAHPAAQGSASTTSTLVNHSPTQARRSLSPAPPPRGQPPQPQQVHLHSPRPTPAAPLAIPPTSAHPSGLGPDGLPVPSSAHPRSSPYGSSSGSASASGPGSHPRSAAPDPRRKKSLELPDLASLALTPVSVPPPGPPRPVREPQQREKYNDLAYGYPPGASNVSPAGTPPARRPSRGRQPSEKAEAHRRASAPASAPPAPPPKEVQREEIDSRPSSPGMGVIYSLLPSGLPERVVQAEEEEEREDTGARTVLRWEGGGKEVLLAGTFLDQWQGRERMQFDPTSNTHLLTLPLPPGLHRFKFIIDGEWRCSTAYDTATDPQGNLINTLVVARPPTPPELPASPQPLVIQTTVATPTGSDDPSRVGSRQNTPTLRQSVSAENALGGRWDSNPRSDIITDAYSPLWTNVPPHILQQVASSPAARAPQLPPPPALPRHLERVILNAADRPGGQADGEDNSILPLPNHVVLNHLTASAIRGGVMAVGITGRYGSKLVTTIYYRPVGL
ncbi:carbohydrate-binding module family 48 protein [Calocera cornea HHB12733]|uniref:Carbohydrate-binding module family 48 protein n=1 Tax=Calocera cornea HHB12733 TaxID=1353952 RepID=A0A165E284_9BASI|nr:carbohydrate-binding module family 48 protein [Calocera cornea HHB12733]